MEDFSDEEEMDMSLAMAHIEARLPFISMSLWGDFIKLAYEEQFKVFQVRVRPVESQLYSEMHLTGWRL